MFLLCCYAQESMAANAKPYEDPEVLEFLNTPDGPILPKSVDEFANAHFESCIYNQTNLLGRDMAEIYCGCSAANIVRTMSLEDIHLTYQDNEQGKLQRDRLTVLGQAPCIGFPLEAIILDGCDKNTSLNNPKGTCKCLSKRMGNYVKIDGPRLIERALYERPTEQIDPLLFIINNPSYGSRYKQNLRDCVSENE
tara:strand:+ start:903 stop:1487 length:585 start_codon:yes stop_codon:yes gene_type:complete